METKDSTLKPYHESIVDEINRAELGMHFEILARILKTTAAPKDHDLITAAWNARVALVDLNSDLGVPESLAAQKKKVEAAVKRSASADGAIPGSGTSA